MSMEDEAMQGLMMQAWEQHAVVTGPPKPFCTGCNRHPADIPGYADQAAEYFGEYPARGQDGDKLADLYAREDGTYNRANGHFLCDGCYLDAGMPTYPHGWVAPHRERF